MQRAEGALIRCLARRLLLAYLCLLGTGDGLPINSNHTIMFISGIPQSGTSLLQQIFAVTPMASTMVDKCFEKHGSKCANWNNEGQWLLGWGQTPLSKQASDLLNVGSICLANSSSRGGDESEVRAFIRDQWGSFWDHGSNVLLVEKSPQNLLKMPLITSIFKNEHEKTGYKSNKLKFLVVLKHPATLNIALPKRTEWLYSLEYSDAGGQKERVKVKKRLQQDKIHANFDFFLKFMDNSGQDLANDRSCAIGWLDAMEKLEQTLLTHRELDVRVLKFEDFETPHMLCLNLMLFAFDGYPKEDYYASAARLVCDKYFSDNVLLAKAATIKGASAVKDRRDSRFGARGSGDTKRLRNKKDNGGRRGTGRRQLRLRASAPSVSKDSSGISGMKPSTDYKELDFSVNSVDSSVRERLKSFHRALKKTSQAYQKKIAMLEKRLNRFGYSFKAPDEGGIKASKRDSVFDKYDIMRV